MTFSEGSGFFHRWSNNSIWHRVTDCMTHLCSSMIYIFEVEVSQSLDTLTHHACGWRHHRTNWSYGISEVEGIKSADRREEVGERREKVGERREKVGERREERGERLLPG